MPQTGASCGMPSRWRIAIALSGNTQPCECIWGRRSLFRIDGKRLLICDLVDLEQQPTGDYVLAVDAVGAGAGELVLILDEGTGARQVIARDPAPVRAVVVGIIDDIDL